MINLIKSSKNRFHDLTDREVNEMLDSYKRTVTFLGYTNEWDEQI